MIEMKMADMAADDDKPLKRGRKAHVVPYVQTDMFQANIVEWPVKDDLASMEFPLFSLSTKPDTSVREYSQPGTNKRVRIIPPVIGAATVFDKDLLLFLGSQIIEARKAGMPISKRVKFDTYDFLTGTSRDPGGNAYSNVLDMLRRLKGTQPKPISLLVVKSRRKGLAGSRTTPSPRPHPMAKACWSAKSCCQSGSTTPSCILK